ncbi:N-acetylglucosamine transport system permease protein [Streptomyces sp. KhCrAH-43]|uniref:carbohydrate ABC transporter permease n=1 Tax=Streptomyces TaxID=1883 RepID=UPI00036312B6|nr:MULTISPECIES: sugar ABC transporter permease [unclassified Streptomyces]MYS39471.1 ABC transporter permease subunit [Streptomyces sp. SID4920]MYX69786.1 ABC transporter permease subunit [Streptomyces sp. SID8373]RAJ59725.1 N-acetylglucosamine transport system permease protein [Streptomyces sp. KhCrAH-43]SEC20693.1 N-acetylglucosamine ABC transporter membrane protein /chitobiose ABC transporter membrane protein [Streptomyces sp. 2131.1]
MQHGKYRFIVGFLVAPLALYAVFVIWPFIQAIYYSFTDWTGLSPDFKMVGFGNYSRMLKDDIFWKSLQHSVVLVLVLPLVTLGLALFFAFMLNVGGRRRKNAAVAGVRGSGFYKIAYFFPQVLSIVIVALLFQFAFNPRSGMLNSALKGIGLDNVQPDWLGDPNLALICVMAVLVWSTVGFFVVLFSAGMASIPKDFYEAALLDGASRVTTFFKITVPLLWDTIQSGWVYMGILALGVEAFTAVQVMTVGPGGPDYSTSILPLYVYQTAFRDGQAGYATTIGVGLLIVTMAFAAIVMRLGRRERLEF